MYGLFLLVLILRPQTFFGFFRILDDIIKRRWRHIRPLTKTLDRINIKIQHSSYITKLMLPCNIKNVTQINSDKNLVKRFYEFSILRWI